MNPYPYLMKAERLIFATSLKTTVTLTVTGSVTQAATGQLTLKVTKLQAFPAGACSTRCAGRCCSASRTTVQIDLGKGKVVGAEAAPNAPRQDGARAHRADARHARRRGRAAAAPTSAGRVVLAPKP